MRKPAFAVLLSIFSSTLFAAGSPEYDALRAARPDGRTVQVKNLTLRRDVVQFDFDTGAFHLLAPVNGRTFGAVFLGNGRYRLNPATQSERRHLALVTGEKDLEVLEDTFDRLILLFSDDSSEEIQRHAPAVVGSPDAKALAAYDDYLKQQRSKYRVNLHLRLLPDILGTPGKVSGVFLAPIDGKKFPPSLIVVDPSGIGNLAAAFSFFGGEETAFISFDQLDGGFWYLSSLKANAVSGRGKPLKAVADASHYKIETNIESNLEIQGTTTIRLTPTAEELRVLPLHILPKLRLREASVGSDTNVGIVQEEVDLGKFARLFKDEVSDSDAALVFASPLKVGVAVDVKIKYEGREVLRRLDGDSYSVQARESWYPNIGTFTDTATYELTFRFPKRNHLISVGDLAHDEVVANQRITTWKSDKPMRVAGFNYGKFEKISRDDDQSNMHIDVYAQKDRSKMLSDTMADAMNASRIGVAFFGEAPFNLSVTQQTEWSFGQSWPSLVYLPTLAMTTSTERVAMFEEAGPELFGINEFAKTVGFHEVAHQWWGHLVGWESYRDQWLSEGFAEFTSALVVQFTENSGKYDDFWERRRDEILSKGSGSVSNVDAGAITQGFRLATRRSPDAAQRLVYSKGAYVLHMLRMSLRDTSKPNADEGFMAMMRDFIKTYSGKNPSTNDFQKIVERHMIPTMNLTGDGKMDYFFQQWVYGTEIPRFKSTLIAQASSGGKYRISGAVSQEGVSEKFTAAVPIYLEFGKGELAKVGTVLLTGITSRPIDVEVSLPKTPKKVVVNALHDVLARN